MTEETLAKIEDWCKTDPALEYTAGDPPTITLTDDEPFVIRIEGDGDGLRLVHEIEDAEPVARSLGDVSARHTFMAAVYDLAGAAERAEERVALEKDAAEKAAAARKAADEAETVAEKAAASAAAAAELASAKRAAAIEAEQALEALKAGPGAIAAAAPAAAPAAAEDVAPAAAPGAFVATHRVPAGGMQAWDVPDGSSPVKAELAARVELRVDEERGAWARVTGSNGWTGWVDGRRLEPIG